MVLPLYCHHCGRLDIQQRVVVSFDEEPEIVGCIGHFSCKGRSWCAILRLGVFSESLATADFGHAIWATRARFIAHIDFGYLSLCPLRPYLALFLVGVPCASSRIVTQHWRGSVQLCCTVLSCTAASDTVESNYSSCIFS